MLTRITNPEISVLGGVLAGIAYRVGLPTWVIRVAFVILLFVTFMLPVLVYIGLWAFLPTQYVSRQEFDLGVGATTPSVQDVEIKKED